MNTDRLLLFTTAVVGLIALIATMVVQYETQQRFQAISIEMDNIRVNIDRAATEAREARADAELAAAPIDDGSIDAILALQERIEALESSPRASAAPPSTALTGEQQALAAGLEGPSEDCIPLGTRFMAQTGDTIAICYTPVEVRVTNITGDTATVNNAGTVVENGISPIQGTPCSVMLLSADLEGFAELRVSC